MRFSIVTPSFNHAKYIEQTILSVIDQHYSETEHIIMDGGSIDGTIDVLKKYPSLKWKSEKDNGQSDAINKGFKEATGDIIAWINSDDYYAPGTFDAVSGYFNAHPGCKCVYGNLTYINEAGEKITEIIGDNVSYRSILCRPDLVRQPATFWKRDALEKTGYLDESLHLVMDLDFFLRMFRLFKPGYIGSTLACFRHYSDNKTLSSLRRQASEIWKVVHRYEKPAPPAFYKFILGRYLDSLPEENLFRKLLTPLRKG